MKVLIYSTKEFELEKLKKANNNKHKITYVSDALDSTTATLAAGYDAISIFSGDDASLVVLEILKELEVRYISLRSAGYNNVSVKSAKRIGLRVANAPEYSPHAIAEHAICLVLGWNRRLITANKQVQQYNFLLNNLIGFNLDGKTVGIIGTGRIGSILVKLFHAFGCELLATDLVHNHFLENQYDLEYVSLKELCKRSDIISINVPLTSDTHYMLNTPLFQVMKPNAVLVNTARGGIVHTGDLLKALKNGTIGGYATDVYEKEKGIFFRDNSFSGISDEQLKELIALPNTLVTPHQAFVTEEALQNIAETTIYNLDCWEENRTCKNELEYGTVIL